MTGVLTRRGDQDSKGDPAHRCTERQRVRMWRGGSHPQAKEGSLAQTLRPSGASPADTGISGSRPLELGAGTAVLLQPPSLASAGGPGPSHWQHHSHAVSHSQTDPMEGLAAPRVLRSPVAVVHNLLDEVHDLWHVLTDPG